LSPLDSAALPGALWRRPLVTLAIALIAGVLVADVVRLPVWALAPLLLWAAVAAARPRAGQVAALSLVVAASCLGAVLHTLRLTASASDVSRSIGSRPDLVTGRVLGAAPGQGRSVVVGHLRISGPSGYPCGDAGRALLSLPYGMAPPPTGTEVQLLHPSIRAPSAPSNWFQRDRRRELARRGIHAVVAADGYCPLGQAAHGLRALATGWREAAVQTLTAAMPPNRRGEDAALLVGMVLGDTAAPLSAATVDVFRRTGTIHLLVVSGAQVSALLLFLTTVLRARRRVSGWRMALVALALAWFGLITGMGASVARSLIMAGLWLLAQLTGRRYDLASGVAVAALALVLCDTSVVFGVGAQLTFAATIGVAVALGAGARGRAPSDALARAGMTPAGAALRTAGLKYHQAAARMVSVSVRQAALGTVGAWLLTTPLLAYHFGGFALLGSLANLVAVPLAAVVVVLGMAAVALGAIWLPLAALICRCACGAIWALQAANSVCVQLPLAFVDNVAFSAWQCVVWLATAGLLAWAWRTGWVIRLSPAAGARVLTAASAAGAALLVASLIASSCPPPPRITALDVGEGQCSVVETPGGYVVVVDAGGRLGPASGAIARDVLVPYLVGRRHRRIDVLVITHPDADHCGAVAALAGRMPVGVVLVGGGEGGATYQRALNALRDAGADIQVICAGSSLAVGDLALQVLWPPPRPGHPARVLTGNDTSVVTRLLCGGVSAVFAGDLEVAGMEELLATAPGGALAASYLQVPHHGRSSAADPSFMSAVSPAVAVVSRAGPPEVREGQDLAGRYSRAVYATSAWGAVAVEATRADLRVHTYFQHPRG
jgi:competence protein ComEC